MMMFTPLIFTYIFLKMPTGLVLYWTVNGALVGPGPQAVTRVHHDGHA